MGQVERSVTEETLRKDLRSVTNFWSSKESRGQYNSRNKKCRDREVRLVNPRLRHRDPRDNGSYRYQTTSYSFFRFTSTTKVS